MHLRWFLVASRWRRNQPTVWDRLMYTKALTVSHAALWFSSLKSSQVKKNNHTDPANWGGSIATKILVDFLLGLVEGTKTPFQLGILNKATEFHASTLKSSAGAPLLKYCRWRHRANKYYKTCLLTLKCQPSKMGFRACFQGESFCPSWDVTHVYQISQVTVL